MKCGLWIFCLILTLGFTGCATGPRAPFVPSQAMLLTATVAPLSTEFNDTPVDELRVGTASTTNICGLFAIGDCSLYTAARNGDLKTIVFADYENFSFFGLYQSTTVRVYGK
jgi:hypothetical protein